MKRLLFFLALLSTSPALAQQTLSGAEFEALTTGRTFSYTDDGEGYGAEQYLSRRGVLWSFEPGQCLHGTWFAQNDEICFVYDDDPAPVCWRFYLDENGLSAELAEDVFGSRRYRAHEQSENLSCPGPKTGV